MSENAVRMDAPREEIAAAAELDVEAIMERIRSEVRGAVERGECRVPVYAPTKAANDSPALIYSDELNYLNANWHGWWSPEEITSHRPVIGKLIVRVKRFIFNRFHHYFMRGYLEREKAFQMNLVRFLNSSAKYVDSRVADIFWQLVRKIDVDVTNVNERLERVVDESDATVRTIEKNLFKQAGATDLAVTECRAEIDHLGSQIGEMNSVLRGLERTLAVFMKEVPREKAEAANVSPTVSLSQASGIDYLLLENRFRGSEEEIKARQRPYVKLFCDAPGTVLDIGCGRGELVELLLDAGIPVQGIDLDEAMVRRSIEKNLPVKRADLFDYLDRAEDSSLGGIIALQVIEHLTKEQLELLLALAVRKLLPGAKIVLETINPNSVTALARNFFRDPTHVWPVHPETLRFAMEMKGLKTEDIRYLAPYPREASLHPIEIAPYLPPRWRTTIQAMNDNVTRLNDLLFGHQDYCVIGTRP